MGRPGSGEWKGVLKAVRLHPVEVFDEWVRIGEVPPAVEESSESLFRAACMLGGSA